MKTPMHCLSLWGVILWTAACSSPDVPLGHGDDSVGKTSAGGSGAGGSGGGAGESSADAAQACNEAVELPSVGDVWWEPHWTNVAQPLQVAQCGFSVPPLDVNFGHTAPSVVAKWVAPQDGRYHARGWARDVNAVIAGSAQCGDPRAACVSAYAEYGADLPEAPFDRSAFRAGGWDFDAKAGETWFFWFYPDLETRGALESGNGVVNISTVPFP
jgi:hypothetical protein